jgi:hypothetical protein
MSSPDQPDDLLNVALHKALARSLPGPELPDGFRARLLAASACVPALDHTTRRRDLEGEHHEQLAALRADFIRIRRRTLGALIGVAFTAGATTAAAIPWITAALGWSAAYAVPSVGAAVGVAIALTAWLRRAELADWLL